MKRKLTLLLLLCIAGIGSILAQPVITSFSPGSGVPGSTVTINGSGFSTTLANNVVFFGQVKATVSAATATSLTVTVPVSALYGPILVLNSSTNLIGASSANFIPTFNNSTKTITATSFAAKVGYTAGTSPQSLAIGDIDGDGKPDLAVGNIGDNTVSVFRNTGSAGNPSFAARVDFATRTGPYSVAIGDLDGDGKPDLAVANTSSKKVSVFRNTASMGSITTSSFAARVDFTTATGPYSVAIGDIDGDGKADLAVANNVSSTVSVFRNTGSAGSITTSSFAAKVDFATGLNPLSVAIGDIDGDGKADLAVASYGSSTVSVLRNTASMGSITISSFAAWVDFATGSEPKFVAIGDIDGDGKADLAAANSDDGTVSVLRNTASMGSITTSSFASKVDFATGSFTYSVAIGDIDGDGKVDLAVANYDSGTVSVFRNTGSVGSITSSSFANKVDFATGSFPYSSAIGDFDGDGKADLVVVNSGDNQVSVLMNTIALAPPVITSFSPGSGVPGSTVTISGSGFSSTLANNVVFFGQVKATVSAATATSLTVTVPVSAQYGPILVLNSADNLIGASSANFIPTFNNSPQTITATSFAAKLDYTTGVGPQSLAIGDIDGDGKPDLAVANYISNTVSVFRNTGSSGNLSFAAKVDFTTGTNPISVAIGDIDGDGKPELAVANLGSNSVSVFMNTASVGSITISSFAPKVDFATGTQPYSVAIGDIDGDGRPDLAVVNNSSSTVSVFRNTGSVGNPSFATKLDYTTGTGPRSVAIGDIDGDGIPDLAVGNVSSSTVSVFRNTGSAGNPSFAAKVDFTTSTNPFSVAIGDIDGDGKADLAVANFSSTVSVFRNTASTGSITTSSFAAKVDYTTGANPRSVAIGDIDGDGKADLTVGNVNSSTVSVFRNTTSAGSITPSSFAAKVDFTTGSSPYSVAIGDLDGDGKADLAVANFGSSTVSVLMNTVACAAPIITMAATSQTICAGATVSLAVSSPATAQSFNWSASPGALTYPSTAGISVSPTVSTTYTVTVSNGPACSATAQTVVTVKQPTAFTQTPSICAGSSFLVGASTYTTTGVYTDHFTNAAGCDSTVTTNLTVNNATATASINGSITYNYTGNPQAFTVPAGVSGLSAMVQGASGIMGSIYVYSTSGPFGPMTFTNSGGGGGKGGLVSSNIAAMPGDIFNVYVGANGSESNRPHLGSETGANIAGGASAIFKSGIPLIIAGGGGNGQDGVYGRTSGGDGGSAQNGDAYYGGQATTSAGPGGASLASDPSLSNVVSTSSVAITGKVVFNYTIMRTLTTKALNSNKVCTGNAVTLRTNVTVNTYASMQWQKSTDGGNTFTDISGAMDTLYTHTATLAENGYQYRVLFTSITGCTNTSVAETLTVKPAPAPGDTTVKACNNFTWYGTTYSTNGNYTHTVTKPGSCDSLVTLHLTIHTGTPVAGFSGTPLTEYCTGSSTPITYTANAGGAGNVNYSWSTAASTAAITFIPSGAASTTYTVTVSNACGTDTKNIVLTKATGIPAATLSYSGPTTLCAGTPLTITSIGGGTYSWNTGASTPAITVTPMVNSTYTVTVTNACGTKSTTTPTITINSVGASVTSSVGGTLCSGKIATLTAVPAAGSTGNTYKWSTGPTTVTLSASTASTYTVTVTNTCGTASAQQVLTASPSPTVTVTQNVSQLTASGTNISTYLWNNAGADVTPTITVTAAGSYKVTVTSTAGCTASFTKTVAAGSFRRAKTGETTFSNEATSYPNPFDNGFTISYETGKDETISIVLYDITGRQLAVLQKEILTSAGNHKFEFNNSTYPLNSGVYLVKVIIGNNEKLLKVTKME